MTKARVAAFAASVAMAWALPGCVVAVGTRTEKNPHERLDRLESRVSAAERAVGITPPAEAAK